MTEPNLTNPASEPRASQRLSPNVIALGFVGMLTAMSSAMIYGLLPVFMVRVLDISVASVGIIEGIAESAASLVKIVSGAVSDRIGRRKPFIVLGYTLSAIIKTIFPVAGSGSAVLAARIVDRLGKGIRDAPRDAFLTDLTAKEIRGAGFGLRLALSIFGFVVGPLIAIILMKQSDDDFRFVFWMALVPAYLSVIVLLAAVKEIPANHAEVERRSSFNRADIAALPSAFWWLIVIAGLLSLARFSQAFLVLKAHDIGVGVAYVPIVLVVMHLIFSVASYPFGILADRLDRRLQLGIGTSILVGADVVLAGAGTIWLVALGAALWGLQFGVTQGLLGATIADMAPSHLRGTAFGVYDCVIGIGAFIASAGAGVLWTVGGPPIAFGVSACIALVAGLMLILGPLPPLMRIAS